MCDERKRMKKVYKIITVICIIVLIFSGYKVATILYDYYKLDKDNQLVRDKAQAQEQVRHPKGKGYDTKAMNRVIDFGELDKINTDVIGWLYIPDTHIDYPILKGANNDSYIRTNIYKNYENGGSIFMEETNNPDFQDSNTIIYGHKMQTSEMFSDIVNWKEKDFFDKHPYVYIYLKDGSVNVYRILSINKIDAYDAAYTPNVDVPAFMEKFYSTSIQSYKTDKEITKLLMLSTCYNFDSNWRDVLHGGLVENVPL